MSVKWDIDLKNSSGHFQLNVGQLNAPEASCLAKTFCFLGAGKLLPLGSDDGRTF